MPRKRCEFFSKGDHIPLFNEYLESVSEKETVASIGIILKKHKFKTGDVVKYNFESAKNWHKKTFEIIKYDELSTLAICLEDIDEVYRKSSRVRLFSDRLEIFKADKADRIRSQLELF